MARPMPCWRTRWWKGPISVNSLDVSGLDAGYGRLAVLHDVALRVGDGQTTVLLGTNGNGKTTLLRCLAGLLRPTRGNIRLTLDGVTHEVAGLASQAMVALGVVLVPEGRRLFPALTVEENLHLGAYRTAARPRLAANMDLAFTLFPVLRDRRRQLAGSMSGGEQQMVALARALMAEPRLLLIDEPSVGLSPLMVRRTMEAIAQLQSGRRIMVLMAEQNFRQAVRIADHGYVIAHGRIAVDAPAAELAGSDIVRAAYFQ